jgi:hypothetical protein
VSLSESEEDWSLERVQLISCAAVRTHNSTIAARMKDCIVVQALACSCGGQAEACTTKMP